MKKIIAIAVIMATLVLCLASCGSFFGDAELKISSITSDLLADGSTRVTISYTNTDIDPHVFIIPKSEAGAPGRDGNGISDITYKHNDATGKTNVIITFTDATMTPVSFSVPDGVSVVGFQDGIDAVSGEKYLVFKYSNGSTSDPLFLPRGIDGADGADGKDGVDGNGIKNFSTITQPDKSVLLTLELDDGRLCEITIPAPERGIGVSAMVSRTESDGYYIDVFYEDGQTNTLFFDRPNTWLRAARAPLATEGVEGDFFFDTLNKVIYTKYQNSWRVLVSFYESVIVYTIEFNLNDSFDASLNGDNIVFINKGETFYSYGYDVPVPTRPGYKFLGWYTSRTNNPNPTMGAFTDLTPVMSNMTLYAAWEPIN